jgi:hypothetical protein
MFLRLTRRYDWGSKIHVGDGSPNSQLICVSVSHADMTGGLRYTSEMVLRSQPICVSAPRGSEGAYLATCAAVCLVLPTVALET